MKIHDILKQDEMLNMLLLVEVQSDTDMGLIEILIESLLESQFGLKMDACMEENMPNGIYVASLDEQGFKFMLIEASVEKIKKAWSLQKNIDFSKEIPF